MHDTCFALGIVRYPGEKRKSRIFGENLPGSFEAEFSQKSPRVFKLFGSMGRNFTVSIRITMYLHPMQIVCSTANAVPFTPRQGRRKSQQRRCQCPHALTPSQLQSIHLHTASPTRTCPHASVTVHLLTSVPLCQSNTDMPTRQCAGTPKRQSANEPTYQCADKPACRRTNTPPC